jgi:hypothetical protein
MGRLAHGKSTATLWPGPFDDVLAANADDVFLLRDGSPVAGRVSLYRFGLLPDDPNGTKGINDTGSPELLVDEMVKAFDQLIRGDRQ